MIDALADRIKTVEPKLNAFLSLALDKAREEADRQATVLREHPAGDFGPLFGVPVAVKDDLGVQGQPLTFGSRLCKDDKATADDVTVARLKAAGAIVIGKTSEPEFGHKGTCDDYMGPGGRRRLTVSPWGRLDRTAGGSSGGSAAAVAAGLAYLALGTDVGGSVRIPASCCGVVGFKPSFGRIPRVPSGNAFSIWQSGPLARTIADVALVTNLLGKPDGRDRHALHHDGAALRFDGDVAGLRVGWVASPTGGPVEPAVAEAGRRALDVLATKARVKVLDAKYLDAADGSALGAAFDDVLLPSFLAEVMYFAKVKTADDLATKAKELSPTLVELIQAGRKRTLMDYLAGQAAMTAFCETTAAAVFDRCDVLACPTIAVAPPDAALPLGPDKIAGRASPPHLGWVFTWLFNVTGEPAISVPCGWTTDGLPVGLQLVAPRGRDARVLRVAAALEKHAPWHDRRPAV